MYNEMPPLLKTVWKSM